MKTFLIFGHQPKVFSSEPQTPIQQYQDQNSETDETEMFKKIQVLALDCPNLWKTKAPGSAKPFIKKGGTK